MVSIKSSAAGPRAHFASDIAKHSPATKILVADHALALSPVFEIAPMGHCDRQRKRLAATGSCLWMEANREFCLRNNPTAKERIVGSETLLRHLPDRPYCLPHTFQRDAFT